MNFDVKSISGDCRENRRADSIGFLDQPGQDARLVIDRPAAGSTLFVKLVPGEIYDLPFAPSEAEVLAESCDITLVFPPDGARIIFEGLANRTEGEALPMLMGGGLNIMRLLLTQGQIAGAELERPAPNQTLEITATAGGCFVTNFDTSEAQIDRLENDFVLQFPDGGRIVLLNFAGFE